MIETSLLKKSEEKEYTEMLHRSSESMFFHSIPYRNLLEEFLSVKSYFVIATKSERIIGAIPTYIKENKEYGNVMNSSPFIGSNGGFIIDSNLNYLEKREIKKKLQDRYNKLAVEKNCVLSTIITSPFDRDILFYEDKLKYEFRDYRVGYIKEFDRVFDNSEESILRTVEKRCRNSITRSEKNLELEYSDDFKNLFELHKNNIEGKGTFKPFKFFELVKKHFKGGEYDLTYALINGKRIAGMLIFYFKDTVEYFTPAFDIEYKKEQATSFLIYEAMKKSIENGFRYWNFGGTTLPSQNEVAYFKKSWGSNEYPYYYYTMRHQEIDGIMNLKAEEILEKYKWFYIIPFRFSKK
jgi:hypothetical protein